MKKQKLNLDQLNVQSFVTNVNAQLQKTVRGGSDIGCSSPEDCRSYIGHCYDSIKTDCHLCDAIDQ